MEGVQGEPWQPLRVRPAGKDEEFFGNPLDYPEVECADGLLRTMTFAAGGTRALHFT